MEEHGILKAINKSIAFHSKRQKKEQFAISNCHINRTNVVEITEAVMFMNHEDKMKVLNKYQNR